ncbi:MAG TPA: site-2 protease family protein [Spirochaetia bacterium]|nr:site-2 protease family protein [Spirochaetia bacterium]
MLFHRSPSEIIQLIIIIVMSLTVHEFAHSLVAISLGDDTSRRQGRLTLNPLAHIDIVGFLMLLIAGFGWAKPVQINTANLKKPRRDEILISLAGPASNLVFAMVAVLMLWLVWTTHALVSENANHAFDTFMYWLALINVSLAIFNMIPIPPLDGSHLITTFLGRVNATLAATYFRYGSLVLLAVILIQNFTRFQIIPIARLTDAIVIWMLRLVGIAGG